MQSQVNLRAGLDFADLLAVVLRHSPNVIMIGEVRDQRTAETAVRAGASGQLVLATIHAQTAVQAIDSMLQYNAKQKFLASSLIAVINQRLVRQLCPTCRREVFLHQPLEVSSRLQNRLAGVQPRLYLSGECQHCFGSGFQSLTCLPEIMSVNQAISELIGSNASSIEIQRAMVEQGMLTLAESATLRVLRGETTANGQRPRRLIALLKTHSLHR